jgi:GNAT superfamily N-acetyltransferase
MGLSQSTLSDEHRAKLDSIVQQMVSNKEPEDNIRMVVDDFKGKYGRQSNQIPSQPNTHRLGTMFGNLLSQQNTVSDDKLNDTATVSPKEEVTKIDPNDPVKSIMGDYADQYSKGLRSQSNFQMSDATRVNNPASVLSATERSEDLKKKQKDRQISAAKFSSAADFVNKNIFDNGLHAKEYLKETAKKNGGKLPENNETVKLALKKTAEYQDVANAIQKYGSITGAAEQEYKQNHPEFAKQMQTIAKDNYGADLIPEAKQGAIVAEYINKHGDNIDAYVSQSPDDKEDWEDLKSNLLNRYPEFGANVVATEISKARQEKGMNSMMANFNSQKFNDETDELAKQLFKDSPTKLKIYNDVIAKDKQKYIDTPGFLNAMAGRIKSAASGSIESLQDIVSPSDQASDIYSEINKESNSVSAGAKGWHRDIATMGDMTGLVAYMAAGGNVLKSAGMNPTIADKVMTGTTFLHDQIREGEMKYPDDPLKAKLSGALNTGAFMAASNVFPSAKVSRVFNAVKPEIENVVSELGSGAITREAAKNTLGDVFSKAVLQHGKGVGEMAALTLFNKGVDKALGLENYDTFHPENELSDVIKSTAIGLTPLTAITAFGGYAQRNAMKDHLLEMASNPKRFDVVLDHLEAAHPEMADEIAKRKENLLFLSQTKQSLDKVPDLTDNQKKQYLLHAANVKSLTEQAGTISDEKIKSKIQKRIDESEKIKDQILDGKEIPKADILPGEDLEAAKKEHEEELKAATEPSSISVISPEQVSKPNVVELKKVENETPIPEEKASVTDEGTNKNSKPAEEKQKTLPSKEEFIANREGKISNADAPELNDLTRTLPEKGSEGFSIETGKTSAGTPELPREQSDIPGYKYVTYRGKDGKVKGIIEVSYYGEGGLKDEPQSVRVVVDPSERNKGIATKLFEHANEQGINLDDVRGKATTEAGAGLLYKYLKSKEGSSAEEKQKFTNFKDHILEQVENVKNNAFDFAITSSLDQKGREQAIKNIREGKDTKAAQQLLSDIQQMYDDGYVYLNRGRGSHSEAIQIPIEKYMAEVNKPFEPTKDLDELNTMLGDDAFNETFDKIYDNEKERTGKIGEVSAVATGEPAASKESVSEGKGAPRSNESITIEEGDQPKESAVIAGEEEKKSGIKNKISKEIRGIFQLPKVDVPKLGNDVEVISQGKELVDSGKINPTEVVNRILSSDSHNMSRDEAKAMQYYMHQLGRHEENLRQQISEAESPEDKADAIGQMQQLSDLYDAATEANIKAGKDWSDVGNIRQITIDGGFNPSREKTFIKDAYGGEIPKEVQEKINGITKERDEAIAEKNRVEELLKKKQAEASVSKMKSSSTPKAKKDYKAKRQDLLEDLKKAQDEHKKWMDDNGIRTSGIGVALTPKMIKIIGQLAKTYVDQGIEKLDEIVHSVLQDVKLHIAGIDKKDVRDAIALYEAEKINTKADKKEARVAAGDIDDSPKPRFSFDAHTEWVKANQRVANAEYKMKVLKRQAFESQKNIFQKGMMWAGRLTRLSVLSGYNVLYKLAAAATIGGAAKRIPEQMIGNIWQTAFKGIAEKAPIEGSPNLAAEVKFYKEFFNPKKFVHNSWEILKTGSSDLNKRFGGAEYEHVPVLYLPTDLHQIIKDPVKRATFEASFKNAMNWATKNGLDVNDPLVIQSLETAAYKRANYEIFQEQNWLSRKFNTWKARMETKGNPGAVAKFIADFMIPVSSVPTNIVRRLATTSPFGLIRGGAKVVDAYRKGIENLKPEEADAVMKQLKQGSLGTALWLIGWFGAASFGGLYSKYNPEKEKREGDLAHDEMEVGGTMLPKPVQHALPLEIIQLAATMRHIYDNYKDKGENDFSSLYEAGMGSVGAMAEQIPIIETGAHIVGSFKEPYEGQKLKDDFKRKIVPQIFKETGLVPKEDNPVKTPKKTAKSNKKATKK